MDKELRREIIIDNYEHPTNKVNISDERVNKENFIKINTNSESCIDNVDLFVKFDNNLITDLYFDGEACAISTSATSIMIKMFLGKSINEDKVIIDIVGNRFLYNMVRTIVGTLLEIEGHNLEPEHMKYVLDSQDRSKAGRTVDPHGLTLMKVMY